MPESTNQGSAVSWSCQVQPAMMPGKYSALVAIVDHVVERHRPASGGKLGDPDDVLGEHVRGPLRRASCWTRA
jgi:hypothetical protein